MPCCFWNPGTRCLQLYCRGNEDNSLLSGDFNWKKFAPHAFIHFFGPQISLQCSQREFCPNSSSPKNHVPKVTAPCIVFFRAHSTTKSSLAFLIISPSTHKYFKFIYYQCPPFCTESAHALSACIRECIQYVQKACMCWVPAYVHAFNTYRKRTFAECVHTCMQST